VIRRLARHRPAAASLVVLAALGMAALFARPLAPYPLNPRLEGKVLAEARHPPSLRHPFGTDELGRDQLTRLLFGARVSLAVGLGVALVSALAGTAIGATAGYLGGRVDQALMRLTDLALVVPGLAVLMMAGKALGGSVAGMIVVLSALYWMTVARVVRGVFLSLRAARASGASSARVVIRHMLPNTIGPIVVNATLVAGSAILTESALSFLGFGVRPPNVSWGSMLAQSQQAAGTRLAYLVWFPGLAIGVTVLAVNFLGDGLRDAFDPGSAP
jgi:peptide/nickel transport system permease protein